MSQHQILGRRLAIERHREDSYRVGEWSPWPEVNITLAGHQGAHITALMTVHADIVGQPSGKFGWVDDASIRFAVERCGLLPLLDVEGAGTVTTLTTDRQLV